MGPPWALHNRPKPRMDSHEGITVGPRANGEQRRSAGSFRGQQNPLCVWQIARRRSVPVLLETPRNSPLACGPTVLGGISEVSPLPGSTSPVIRTGFGYGHRQFVIQRHSQAVRRGMRAVSPPLGRDKKWGCLALRSRFGAPKHALSDGAGVSALREGGVTKRWCQAGLGGRGTGTIYVSPTVLWVTSR